MPNERNTMKSAIVGLLSAAVLLTAAGPASAATLGGSTQDPDGQDAGRITLRTKAKKDPATGSVSVLRISSIELSGVPVTCDDGGQLSIESLHSDIRAKITVRRRGHRYRFSAQNLEGNPDGNYRISGFMNRRGTKVYGGVISGDGITDGADMRCSLQTAFTASTGG
jgi:hypothetical protein